METSLSVIKNKPLCQIIGHAFLGITCLSIMAAMVACIEEDPISPLVAQCQEREPIPQVLGPQAQRIKYVGDIFRDCPSCPEMIVLPAGVFLMGSPPDAWHHSADLERPYHPVTIPEPFAVGRYEVTFDEWDACVAEGGCACYEPEDNDWGRGRRPVINVSWEDVQDYLYWLGRKTGKPYRLLSEAEWEYAVRAGTTTDNYWGNAADSEICTYANVSKQAFDCEGEEMTLPVGSFRSNPFGLYDMIGNVQEWTADCWNYTYDGAPADGRAWQQGECDWRVTRGRSFYWQDLNAYYFRSAGRTHRGASTREHYIGFRVARAMTVAQEPVPLE